METTSTKRIDTNLLLQTASTTGSKRPLVILFSWLLAKDRHIAKYRNLYTSQGFDVLSIRVSPTEVLQPKKAQDVIKKTLGILQEAEQKLKPLVIHGFSVGGYVCGEMMVELEKNAEKYFDVRQRLLGQIFDSPVDYEGVPTGFANVLSNNKMIQKLLKVSIESYLKLFKNSVTKYYMASSEAFHNNSLELPSLMLYSRADPIGVDKNIETVMKKWKAKGLPVQTRCWQNTPHVSHFHHHPDEYVESILTFMDSIGLGSVHTPNKDIFEEEKEKFTSKMRN
ncbi:hypothetical protein LOTGIDRAFT_121859 [Lottia gigantea]|uniref:Uncharacterized protein n=1 Tax=Lottia gigantea TaxID=225164 RepID=V3ZJU4_LOTGI|nr:hypothetical protein LOTGIDRAFT_121859 [Lottia gigantea]ESO91558.1 hypothetical protein LOTGIDRAFT_121859 [Lottia gigantea]